MIVLCFLCGVRKLHISRNSENLWGGWKLQRNCPVSRGPARGRGLGAGGGAGGLAGGLTFERVPVRLLKVIFGLFLLYAGVRYLLW